MRFLPEGSSISKTEKGISLGFSFSKLEHKIFYNYRNEILGIEDIESFIPLNNNYGKDKNNVYFISRNYNDKTIDAVVVSEADPLSFMIGIFPYDDKNVFFGSDKIISSKDLELLAIFGGYRPGCGQDRTPYTNHYFIKNKEGYWLLEYTWYSNSGNKRSKFLGKTFDPNWNKVFKNFELAD